MSSAKEHLLRKQGFDFFGTITASLSHEINNVFAIINELSGLLDDWLVAADHDAPLDAKKVKGITQRIATQIKRGQGYIKQLNELAHTTDDEQSTVVLNEAARTITALCQRFGTLRRVELETTLPETAPRIETNAFDLQHVMFRCIDIVLAASNPGDTVRMDIEPQGDGARMKFAGGSVVNSVTELESRVSFLTTLIAEMQGTTESEIHIGQPVRLTVSLPSSVSARETT